jgi:hypothetical protein
LPKFVDKSTNDGWWIFAGDGSIARMRLIRVYRQATDTSTDRLPLVPEKTGIRLSEFLI